MGNVTIQKLSTSWSKYLNFCDTDWIEFGHKRISRSDPLALIARLMFNTFQKMKFSIKDFFSECDQETADLVTFTKEILKGKLHFLCSVKAREAGGSVWEYCK